jgi:hypothetical protein
VIEPRAIFHSDRGSVYTSADYRLLVKDLGMRSSMGRTGVCRDNAMAESFFSALKNERVYRTVYATKAQARRDVIAYIEGFYNSRRRQSAHHIGIGRTHARTHVILLIQDLNVRIVNAVTGELLRGLIIDPERDYRPRNTPRK